MYFYETILLNLRFDLILIILLGLIFGIITGLIPGVHINLISTFILLNFTNIKNFFNIQNDFFIIIFLVTMGLTFTFVDFIPTIFLGIPDEETNISILPAQKLVLEGKGFYALKLSLFGSFLGAIFSLVFIVLLIKIIIYYEIIKRLIPFLLIFTILFFIFKENGFENKIKTIFIILISGTIGLILLNSKNLNEPLFIIFSGMFGLSNIFLSMLNRVKIPKQEIKDYSVNFEDNFLSVILGAFGGLIASILPGIGNSQVATILSTAIKEKETYKYIIITSTINTINFILSIFTFYFLFKARNGVINTLKILNLNLNKFDLLNLLYLILILSLFLVLITKNLGKLVILFLNKLNIKYVNFFIIILIFILVFLSNNFLGLLILIMITSFSIFSISLNVKRIHLMSVLIIPIIFYLI